MNVHKNHALVYEPVASSESEYGIGSTVVATYEPEKSSFQGYQSEADLERLFIRQLEAQAYEFVPVRCEEDLIANLRQQLGLLNETTFSDTEWERFFRTAIANERDTIADKAERIQGEGYVQELVRDDGTISNIKLIDRINMHNNRLQVINQYEVTPEDDRETPGQTGARLKNRYDVTILVNGLPMVHVELKRRGVDLREAFNQIRRYGRDSFWTGRALFDYVQLFVISNGTLTKYYSNTTRMQHVEKAGASAPRQKKQTSNSYEFTSWWADATNKPIQELGAFTRTFFAKHSLLAVLTRYCILTHDKTLLVMRPYQIAACEQILRRIETSSNYKKWGTIDGGGYIWHTTGSGKTLTSFKTAQLATQISSVDKVLFVVDRKDLDYQTMKEYDRFEKGAANSNTSTAVLERQLSDDTSRIIITTINKLANFIKKNPSHDVYKKHVVIIFDECHRSQFGSMHAAITKSFKKYHLFGFTGTPIFAVNAPSPSSVPASDTGRSSGSRCLTTQQVFGDKLHTYNIIDAIRDKNVLPFRVSYVNTLRAAAHVPDDKVAGINTESALLAPQRIQLVTEYILDNFARSTKRDANYELRRLINISEVASGRSRKVQEIRQAQRVSGFNAMFATSSIDAARAYYREFQRQQADLVPDRRLKIATIFSYQVNQDVEGISLLPDESMDPGDLGRDDRDFLADAISDYNAMFRTNYDTSADGFENYYKDVSLRLKNRELDLVIVVNMFLTGFDATTLNTLFVDKNLRYHGLIQAFSRTNRILNSVKAFGNIVSFRNLEDETNDAIALFGDEEARGIVVLRPYPELLKEYQDAVAELFAAFPLGADGSVPVLASESEQKEFISLFGGILRAHNILRSFDEFVDPERGDNPLSPRMMQNYQSLYLDLYQGRQAQRRSEEESINDDVVFEIELIKQVEINVDYILMLVEKLRKDGGADENKELLSEISRSVDASPTLRNKKDLVEAFVEMVSAQKVTDIDLAWRDFLESRRAAELETIIQEEHLIGDQARKFMDAAFNDGELQTSGTEITAILPRVSRFNPNPEQSMAAVKARVVKKLSAYFDRYADLVIPGAAL